MEGEGGVLVAAMALWMDVKSSAHNPGNIVRPMCPINHLTDRPIGVASHGFLATSCGDRCDVVLCVGVCFDVLLLPSGAVF